MITRELPDKPGLYFWRETPDHPWCDARINNTVADDLHAVIWSHDGMAVRSLYLKLWRDLNRPIGEWAAIPEPGEDADGIEAMLSRSGMVLAECQTCHAAIVVEQGIVPRACKTCVPVATRGDADTTNHKENTL